MKRKRGEEEEKRGSRGRESEGEGLEGKGAFAQSWALFPQLHLQEPPTGSNCGGSAAQWSTHYSAIKSKSEARHGPWPVVSGNERVTRLVGGEANWA